MKILVSLALSVASYSAMAAQTIECVGGHGRASLDAKIVLTNKGSINQNKSHISMSGVWQDDAMYGQKFTNIVVNQSKPDATNTYAILFFNDAANGELVEYQLQFEEAVFGKNFRNIDAKLVIGMESNSSEESHTSSFALMCSGESTL